MGPDFIPKSFILDSFRFDQNRNESRILLFSVISEPPDDSIWLEITLREVLRLRPSFSLPRFATPPAPEFPE